MRAQTPSSFFPTLDILKWQHQIHHQGPWHFSYLVLDSDYPLPCWVWSLQHKKFKKQILGRLLCEHLLTFSTSPSHSSTQQLWVGQPQCWVLTWRCCIRLSPPRPDGDERFAAEVGERPRRGAEGAMGAEGKQNLSWSAHCLGRAQGTTYFLLWFSFTWLTVGRRLNLKGGICVCGWKQN